MRTGSGTVPYSLAKIVGTLDGGSRYGVGVDGVTAGTGASTSAAFTIARPGRHSHQTPVL